MADRMEPRAEITSADVDRVDAVDEPATGIPFLVLKTQAAPADAADPARAEAPVVKAEDAAVLDGTTASNEEEAAIAEPGSGPWEAVDAEKAAEAVQGLVAVRALLNLLCDRETAEGDESIWSLMDASAAVDCALGTLAAFAVTEQAEADAAKAEAEAQARALGLIKSLFPTTPEEEPAMATPTKAELLKALEADLITKAQEGGIEDATLGGLFIRKAQNEDLPTGVIDLLNQIVAVMNAIDDVSTGADQAEESPVDTGEAAEPEGAPSQPDAESPVEDSLAAAADAPAEGDAPAADAPADGDAAPADDDSAKKANPFAKSAELEPAEDALGADVPGSAASIRAAEDRRAEMRKAQDAALAAQIAHRDAALLGAVDEHRAAHHLPPVAVAKGQEKSLEDRIAEAVVAAVNAATAPLQKRISELEETPVDTGVLLSGHVPGTPAPNAGQGATAGPAKADLMKSAAASGDLGKQTDAVLDAIKAIHRGEHV